MVGVCATLEDDTGEGIQHAVDDEHYYYDQIPGTSSYKVYQVSI